MRLLRLLAPCFAALGLLILGGCASPSAGPALAVSLVDVRPQEATPFETRLLVTVRLTNPNPSEISFKGSSHELAINNRAMGGAVSSEIVTVPALSSVTQETTLNLSNIALVGLIRELQRQPAASYSIRSTLFTSGVFSRSVRAEHSGKIDLSAIADDR
jgi:LEA14-like dessication related protein